MEGKKVENERQRLENEAKLMDMFKDDTQGFMQALHMLRAPIPVAPRKDDTQPYNSTSSEIVPDEGNECVRTRMPVIARPCGPKVQLYDGNDPSRLLRVFDGITEATRGIDNSSFTRIKFVAKNRLVYLGYRWFLLDRNDPNPDTSREIGPTATSHQRITGFVAMLDLDKTSVVKVFATQKDGAAFVSRHVSAISPAVKYGTAVSGHYWKRWDELDADLQAKYLETSTLPEMAANTRGIQVQQLDAETLELVETHASIADVVKKFTMSPKSLKLAELKRDTYHGFKWKFSS